MAEDNEGIATSTSSKNKEEDCSFVSRFFLTYLDNLIATGRKQTIEHNDLGAIAQQDKSARVYAAFECIWQQDCQPMICAGQQERISLNRVLWKTVGYSQFVFGIVSYAVYQMGLIGPIMIMNALVKHFEGIEVLSRTLLWILVILLFVIPMMSSGFAAHSNVVFSHCALQFRNALVNKIFRKSLRLSPTARQQTSTGEIINVFSTDTRQIMGFLFMLNQMVLSLPTIVVCLYLVYGIVGNAVWIGLALILVGFPINLMSMVYIKKCREAKVKESDIRTRLMSEILNGIRVIKCYAWEDAFQAKVVAVRKRELVHLRRIAYAVAIFFTLGLQAVPVFLPVVTFYAYIRVFGGELSTARVFTSISYFNLLSFPFIFLPLGISNYVQMMVSCQRIVKFLCLEELQVYVGPVSSTVDGCDNGDERDVVVASFPPPSSPAMLGSADHHHHVKEATGKHQKREVVIRFVRSSLSWCLPQPQQQQSPEQPEPQELQELQPWKAPIAAITNLGVGTAPPDETIYRSVGSSEEDEDEGEEEEAEKQERDATFTSTSTSTSITTNATKLAPERTTPLSSQGIELTILSTPAVGANNKTAARLQPLSSSSASSSSSSSKPTGGFQLTDINIEIKKGQLVAIVGPVGSGKSSLLSALLGEMVLLQGAVQMATGSSVAYCDQRPWILNETVRDNILFGRAYDEALFDQTMHAAHLEVDVKILPGGVNTQIGERGINLSGGQKARVALARAVYSDADIYLLDDVMSAVDAHVGDFLFEECVLEELVRKRGKTVLLITHNVNLLGQCDLVVAMQAGRILAFGTQQQLIEQGIDVKALLPHSSTKISSSTAGSTGTSTRTETEQEEDVVAVDAYLPVPEKDAAVSAVVLKSPPAAVGAVDATTRIEGTNVSTQEATQQMEEQERGLAVATVTNSSSSVEEEAETETAAAAAERHELLKDSSKSAAVLRRLDERRSIITSKEEKHSGAVTAATYTTWVASGGLLMFTGVLLFAAFMQAFQVLGLFWLAQWGTASLRESSKDGGDGLSPKDNLRYLNVYAALGAFALACYSVRAILAANHRMRTSTVLHQRLLDSVLACPVGFFDVTPIGRIISRFSQDLATVDQELSMTSIQLINGITQCMAAICGVAVATKGTFLLLLLPVMFFYHSIQKLYRSTNTAVARCESVSRSPIYTDFSQVLVGMSSLRAYGAQEDFICRLEKRVDYNSIAVITGYLLSSWLAVRLDFISAVIALFIAVLAVLTEHKGFISAGSLALGLVYAFQLATFLKYLIKMYGQLEAQMNSVERILFYCDKLDHEVKNGIGELAIEDIPSTWPDQGCIVAKNVALRYQSGPLILKDLSFNIRAREKVGIAGRTGSGKSSLFVGLFRIEELASGSICIDGLDVSKVPLKVLRSRLGIIPQESVMFFESLRFNLDPFNEYSDAAVWAALECVQLKDYVSELPMKLSESVSEGGENFSAGQRQLVCIARALLRQPKVLVLDEATASIDNETDAIIQRMVRQQFEQCTVLTIAHRLHTVIDSDRIMVIDNGHLVEMDTPANLLAETVGSTSISGAVVDDGSGGGAEEEEEDDRRNNNTAGPGKSRRNFFRNLWIAHQHSQRK